MIIEDYRLRPLEESDLTTVLEWRNSVRIRAYMYTDQMISWQDHLAWYQGLMKNDISLYQVFEFKDSPIGVCNFHQENQLSNRWSWGFYIGKEDAPAGSGSLMGQMGLEFAFEQLGVRKLCGECFTFNNASIKFHQKLGFLEEGRLKKHVFKNGIYEDIILFGLLKEDYSRRNVANADF